MLSQPHTKCFVKHKIYEVNPYMMQTEHMLCVWRWCSNADFYDGLPEHLRAVVDECATEACDYGNEILPDTGEKIFKELADANQLTLLEVDKAPHL